MDLGGKVQNPPLPLTLTLIFICLKFQAPWEACCLGSSTFPLIKGNVLTRGKVLRGKVKKHYPMRRIQGVLPRIPCLMCNEIEREVINSMKDSKKLIYHLILKEFWLLNI